MTGESVRKFAQSILPTAIIDTVGVVSIGSIAYGAWLAWPPAGFIIGGALVLAIVYLVATARQRPDAGSV